MAGMNESEAILAAAAWAAEYDTQLGEPLWMRYFPSYKPRWVMVFAFREHRPEWCWYVAIRDDGQRRSFAALQRPPRFREPKSGPKPPENNSTSAH
jgi:hypothetical protein